MNSLLKPDSQIFFKGRDHKPTYEAELIVPAGVKQEEVIAALEYLLRRLFGSTPNESPLALRVVIVFRISGLTEERAFLVDLNDDRTITGHYLKLMIDRKAPIEERFETLEDFLEAARICLSQHYKSYRRLMFND